MIKFCLLAILFAAFSTQSSWAQNRPQITATRPANHATQVEPDVFIAADIRLTNQGGIDPATMTNQNVTLVRSRDQKVIEGLVNTSGGGDAIVFQPTQDLAPNTTYTFKVTDRVKDVAGAGFTPIETQFTTGATIASDPEIKFEKIPQPSSRGSSFTSVVVGPDHKLYATSIEGTIVRFVIQTDGSLGAAEKLKGLQNASGGMRLLTGITFDPSSTADNLIAWASHSNFSFENAPDWSGKITRLSGPDLASAQDYVVGLPRSVRDHATNHSAFRPGDASHLYISQGSNTAMGAPDAPWGFREEHKLNAAILKLDIAALEQSNRGRSFVPLNVQTSQGNTYSPFAVGAELTIYASGIRNAFDMIFASNGELYAVANGSAAGGNSPATPDDLNRVPQRIDAGAGPYDGGKVLGLHAINQTEEDWLFRVTEGGYYGHPNPSRGEYVFNGGNPAAGFAFDVGNARVTTYAVGTRPDRNYRGFAYDFGKNFSPNGIIEYHGQAFNRRLDGKLLVARWSGGKDIAVLTLGADKNANKLEKHFDGLTHFNGPLALVEDPSSGFIYVADANPHGTDLSANQIILLKAKSH